MAAGKFEISKDKAGKFRFHPKAANGEIIAASHGYETKASAEKGIEAVKKAAADAEVVDLTEEPAKKQGEVTPEHTLRACVTSRPSTLNLGYWSRSATWSARRRGGRRIPHG